MIALAQLEAGPYGRALAPISETVVLAEADDDIRDHLATELRKDGYVVVELEDGMELQDYLEEVLRPRRLTPSPLAVVAELDMPGYSGMEVLEGLRRRGDGTPFILINSTGSLDVDERAERLGASFVLQKPVDVDELRSALAFAG